MHADPTNGLDGFSGIVRLFPLPNLVFFPGAVQPLHIFEMRYRAMMEDALAGDRLITLVLLKDGWEEDYDDAPAIHGVACVGKIMGEVKLPDGRYNLVLKGLARVKILEELAVETPFRQARVETVQDKPSIDLEALSKLRKRLEAGVMPAFAKTSLHSQLETLFRSDMPLTEIGDILSFAMPMANAWKQKILQEENLTHRVEKLIEGLEGVIAQRAATQTTFPPQFSAN
jgi:uncharacterized protein